MIDINDKKEGQRGIENPEKGEISSSESVGLNQRVESKEILEKDDARVSAELRKEIEMMEMDDSTKAEAKKKAQKIEFLGEKEKIEHLLQMAREKGLVFAIRVAREMNEPYLLDILHDTLAQEGFYRDFMSPSSKSNNDDKF